MLRYPDFDRCKKAEVAAIRVFQRMRRVAGCRNRACWADDLGYSTNGFNTTGSAFAIVSPNGGEAEKVAMASMKMQDKNNSLTA